jgi:hypothetical protein
MIWILPEGRRRQNMQIFIRQQPHKPARSAPFHRARGDLRSVEVRGQKEDKRLDQVKRFMRVIKLVLVTRLAVVIWLQEFLKRRRS